MTDRDESPTELIPEQRRMSRPVAVAVVAVLAVSGLSTALTSAVLTARDAPDERHHYTYVQHLARHPLQFPPRYEEIRSDRRDPNHLIHPPLYYQLMAIPYSLLDVERQLTEPVRTLDRYGLVSSFVAIAPLRTASLIFAVIHLIGLYLLLRELVSMRVLPGWGAVLVAACVALVPAFVFIAGTLNNDALVLAIWPFLVLATFRFLRDPRPANAYLATALTAAAVLTKATLWWLALVCALAVAVRAVLAVEFRGRPVGEIVRRVRTSLSPVSTGEWVLLGVAVVVAAAATTELAVRAIRYGAIQPPYHVVFGLPMEESQFYRVPEGGVATKSFSEFVALYAPLTARTLFGVITHGERVFPLHPGRFAQVVGLLLVLTLLLVAWRLLRGRQAVDWIAAGLFAVVLAYLVLVLVKAFRAYHGFGHFGAQGRYYIGYLDLWVVALVSSLARVRSMARSVWGRRALAALTVCVGAVMLWLFVRPFDYLSRTTELHHRAQVAKRVEALATRRGLSPVPLEAVEPEGFVLNGSGLGEGHLPSPRFLLAWRGSTLSGTVETGGTSCIEIWVYGMGDRAWGENSELELRLAPTLGAEALLPCADATVELPPRPEVASVVLAAAGMERGVLTVKARNVRAPAPWPLFEELWVRSRVPQVFAVYAGAASCR